MTLIIKQASDPKKVKKKINELIKNKITWLLHGDLFVEKSKIKLNQCDKKLAKIAALIIYNHCLTITSGRAEDLASCLEQYLSE